MARFMGLLVRGACLLLLVTAAAPSSTAVAQTAVFSLEAVAVNSVPIPGGSAAGVKANPGDILTAQMFIRDWSADGRKLRSYQATLDSATFTSGEAGKVAPVGYGEAPTNNENAFIDEKDSRFVHKGMHILPVVDTSSPQYRFIDVLFDETEAPLSEQDGAKFSCGTVRMKVSDDARGTFRLALVDNGDVTLIVDPFNVPITPLATEPLVVEVVPSSSWLRIQASDPANGAVDARVPAKGDRCAWDSIRLTSTGDAAAVVRDDFSVEDGNPQPPKITKMTANGSTVELMFDRGISAYRWTTVTHKPSGTTTRIACLPGDVNNDAVSDGRDISMLIEALNGVGAKPIYQTDIDADGKVAAGDLSRLIDVLEQHRRNGRTRLRGN